MPTYSYHCAICGHFDLVRPMADAGAEARCPACDGPGRRVFAAPALAGLEAGMRRALDVQDRSADAPQVVRDVPPRSADRRRRTMRTSTDPRHARLPRP